VIDGITVIDVHPDDCAWRYYEALSGLTADGLMPTLTSRFGPERELAQIHLRFVDGLRDEVKAGLPGVGGRKETT